VIEGLRIHEMKQVPDERGVVRELFRASTFPGAGPWLQVNVTENVQGAVRGMHAEDMTKLVCVASGAALAAWVDLRVDSATFGAVETLDLVPGVCVLVPPGVGNGFQATAAGLTQYVYCFDREWEPGMRGVACTPLDPELGITWPLPITAISDKDRSAPKVAELRA
jgi:dTDP-4-dehydrorhamnose 3,5-epimerase